MAEWNTDENPTSEPFDDGGGTIQVEGWDVQGNDEVVDAPRKQRIRKGDIEKLKSDHDDESEKFISIWTRAGKDKPLMPLLEKFPANAAMVFSEVWKKQLDRGTKKGSSHAALIIEDVNIKSCKRILDWIVLCIEEGNDIKFPEIEDENPLEVLLDIIATANQLKIPEMSLQEQLKKSAMKYARKALIGWEYVERLYDQDNDLYIDDPTLQEAAAASIFEAWWTHQLDDPELDEYCSFLEQMRVEFPKLDEDLNGRFAEKKAFIEKKREERKNPQLRGDGAGDRYGSGDKHGNGNDQGSTNGADGGWGNAAAATAGDAADEWGTSGEQHKLDTGDSGWGGNGDTNGW